LSKLSEAEVGLAQVWGWYSTEQVQYKIVYI